MKKKIKNYKHIRIGEGEETSIADLELQDFNEPALMNDKTETTSDFTLTAAFFSFRDDLTFRVELSDDSL